MRKSCWCSELGSWCSELGSWCSELGSWCSKLQTPKNKSDRSLQLKSDRFYL
ncbi:MAG: hypothetical protein V7L14_16795 [Nostoc sp.]|uniref:hypothetical protein n=1 Tax=Nostoc sp. TaxID=1180 RepID=UPI002FF59C27